MTEQPTSHERRILNDAIESTYLEVVGLSSKIEMFYQVGRGLTILDLYENYYFFINLLYRLTANEEEMIKNFSESVESLHTWLKKPAPKKDQEMIDRCIEGINLFEKYDLALRKSGIIVLPHKVK